MKEKKRHFVLFEVLIAFALVSMAALPFFRYPYQHMQKELSLLFEIELEQVAQNKLVYLHEQLLKKQIAAPLLFTKEQKGPVEANEITVTLPNGFTRKYQEKVFITPQLQKQSISDQTTTSLIQFKVEYRESNNNNKSILKAESEAVAQKKQ